LQERQQSYISQLQEEIKNAKIVLQNRNMRNKYFEKLKDYKEEAEKLAGEDQRSQVPLRMSRESKQLTARHKVRSTSRSIVEHFVHDSLIKASQSIASSQNMPIFTRKISASRNNCIEIRPRSYTPNVIC
jgi:hypothetical protein